MNRDSLLIFENYLKSKKIVLVAGIHGDEPAGMLACKHFYNDPRIVVIDNINTTKERELDGKDLNRQFDTDNKMAKSILDIILFCNPKLVITMHEDVDAKGFYCYCSPELDETMQSIVKELKLNTIDSIYGDKANNGVISNSKDPYKGSLEEALTKRGHLYCTIETPTNIDINERVKIQIDIINKLIDINNNI